ncbi:MAG: ABC transporter ATP-binding protein [Betaproteobacteria bacterium RIFCSPHIGHO2_12_FULL_69_13]|nr:MAG: ABC transporter ATP-binding protein [Betaproteobacteria bacterium RIFCSPHIGHO2_12_FULL_69_13]OGA69918.1 MAG: ABC transporter ATP-binding protein [Betaproteobacteria bacterium RIFCSPLOWO2_12_FULL_68_20]
MLEIRRLRAGYGRATVLFDLDLVLNAGEVTVLLGRNGAGKSTTLKSVMGLVQPTSGEIVFEGKRIDSLAPYRIARLGLGYVPEERRIFTDLTVDQNLEVGRRPPRPDVPEWTADRVFSLFPHLAAARSRAAARLSGGEQKMLAISRTLMGNPSVLLLDEPSEGLAPLIVEHMARTIIELKRTGLAVLLCEQNLRFARRVADRAYVIETGQVRYGGTLAGLEADSTLRGGYLSI